MASHCKSSHHSSSSGPRDGPHHQHTRTSRHAIFRLRCAERPARDHDRSCPVSLVVFDLDETLTLVTFMTPNGSYQGKEGEWARKVNFESPWVEGSRLEKLGNMLTSLKEGGRVLAVLTKNAHRGGVKAVLNLMEAAGLAKHFSAVWTMPWREGVPNGAYNSAGSWKYFNPPMDRVPNHKADILHDVAKQAKAWFPQMDAATAGSPLRSLSKLRPEGIVLVDDQRLNFQSETGLHVARYAKVARYDAHFMSFGLVKDMGGIGAHDDADYETLKRFVEDPWMCKETLQVKCLQRDMDGSTNKCPVQLVVFDFDETLTLATFMPQDVDCTKNLGWTPDSDSDSEWTKADLVTYNFESPYGHGSRVAKLRSLFHDIAQGAGKGGGQKRALAVLTRNESGVVAVLNLLLLAGLAEHVSAVWTLPHGGELHGAYQEAGKWRFFEPPFAEVNHHKADVLHHVWHNPSSWFPQLKGPQAEHLACLRHLTLEGIVLVDDERANLRSYSSQAKILRYCKVARYDEVYRDCGLLNQMGGLGAHSDTDFDALRNFLDHPWEFPYEPTPKNSAYQPEADSSQVPVGFERSMVSEDVSKAPRRRKW